MLQFNNIQKFENDKLITKEYVMTNFMTFNLIFFYFIRIEMS